MSGSRPLHLAALFSPVPGHLHPFAVLGRELARRGHRVTALNIPDVGASCEAQGIGFRAVGTDVMPPGSWEQYWTPIATSTGLGAIRATARAHRLVTRAMCVGVPDAHRALGFDGLLVDQIQFQGSTIAGHLGLPFATLAPFIPLHRDAAGERPPPFLPFDRARTPIGRTVNRLGYEVLEVLARPVMKETNAFARRWGQPPVRRTTDTFSRSLQLTQCPAALDFLDLASASPSAAGVHYVGSLLDDQRPEVDFPWDALDPSKPLVYVSLGTLQNQRPEIYEVILRALDRHPVQGVISLGRWRGGAAPPISSDRHLVVEFAPQQALIGRADIVVSHAGMNTTIESLAAGVPLLLVPITNDQPAVAKRVELRGAGLRMPLSKLDERRFADALGTMLRVPRFRSAAQVMAGQIENSGGVCRAADLVEQNFTPEGNRSGAAPA